MWMLYLRFDCHGEVKTYHVTAPNKRTADAVYALAEQRGLRTCERLVEYAAFYSRQMIKPKQVPNFHFYDAADFEARWLRGEA